MTRWPSTWLIIFSSASLHREAWRALLSSQPDILIVDAVADVCEVAPLLQPDQPTTVLVDVFSPQPDLAQQLRTIAPEEGLLFLVQSYELSEVLALLRAGATGCISRDASVGDLARTIIAVGRGEIALPPHILAVYRDNATLAHINLRGGIGLDPDFAHAWEAFIDRVAIWVATYLDQAIEQRLLPRNSQVVVYCVVGMIERVAYHWLVQDMTDGLDTLANVVAGIELLGILGESTLDVELVLIGEEASP